MIAKHQIAHDSKHGTVSNLKNELANVPAYAFGDHSKCCEYYCIEQITEYSSLTNTAPNFAWVVSVNWIQNNLHTHAY